MPALPRNTIVETIPVQNLTRQKTIFDLRHRHKNYLLTERTRLKSRILYEGSYSVKQQSHVKDFLYKEENENESDYNFRVKRATVDPWVEKIVIARQSLLFNNQHKRNLAIELEQYIDDVDNKGTSADVFFFNVAENAQIDGIFWVEIDMTQYMPRFDQFGAPIPRTKADDIIENHRPYFNQINGSQVIDWDIDDEGNLYWAVIEIDFFQRDIQNVSTERHQESLGWGYPQVHNKIWKVWTKNNWYIYEIENIKGNSATFKVLDFGEHGLNEVPLKPFYGFKEADFIGWPVATSVLDHIILMMNKDSDLDWYERLSSHPIPYTIGPKKPDKLDVGKGLHLETSPEGQNAKIGYLETSGSCFESLRKSIQDIRVRIKTTVLSQAKKESSQVQSADAQKEDRKEFQTSLRSASYNFQLSEIQCWLVMYKWITGDSYIYPNEIQNIADVTYSKDFDESTIDSEMIKTLSDLNLKEQYPKQLFIEKLIEGEVISDSYNVEEVLRMIEEDQIASLKNMQSIGFQQEEGEEDEEIDDSDNDDFDFESELEE